jgi:hypothetical protein
MRKEMKTINNLLSFAFWILLIGACILLVFITSNFGFFQHIIWLYFNPQEISFWATLDRGNWTKLIITAYSSAGLLFVILTIINRLLFSKIVFLVKSIISILFSLIFSFLSIQFFASFILKSGHWREHCFGICLLPPDEGNLILITSCVSSALIYLIRLKHKESHNNPLHTDHAPRGG